MNEEQPQALGSRRSHDPLWHLLLGIAAVIGLQLVTSNSFLPFQKLWLTVPEIILLIAILSIRRQSDSVYSRRGLTITLIALITAINIFSLVLLINALLFGQAEISGHSLLINGLVIYVTNVLMFALWYWQLDGGGPERRLSRQRQRDFLFPQMIHERYARKNWLPGFTDYLYLSGTNVTNFASADTQPLTHRAKMMMMTQALVSVTTVVLVLARAISVLR